MLENSRFQMLRYIVYSVTVKLWFLLIDISSWICGLGISGLEVGDKIQNWVENMRKWIAATVLKPLVKVCDQINGIIFSKFLPSRRKFFNLILLQLSGISICSRNFSYLAAFAKSIAVCCTNFSMLSKVSDCCSFYKPDA